MSKSGIINLAVFASTNASDFPAIFESLNNGILKDKCKIVTGIVSNSNAGAITKFDNFNIPYLLVSLKGKDKKSIYDEIDKYLNKMNIDMIICIGWMHIITEEFVKKWNKKILNIHPSLLPKYPGMHAIDDAIKSGENITGCTVHFIDEGIDTGEIILQKEVLINKNDSFEILKSKIQEVEQEIYPKAILKVIS